MSDVKIAFTQLSRCWYFDLAELDHKTVDKIDIRFIDTSKDDDRFLSSFSIHFINFDDCISPRILAYNDAWKILFEHKELQKILIGFDTLHNHKRSISPDEVVDIFIKNGFIDETVTPDMFAENKRKSLQ